MQAACRRAQTSCSWTQARGMAISVAPPKYAMPGRTFSGKKADQYEWYTAMLAASHTSPLLVLNFLEFRADKLVQLRQDIIQASRRVHKPTPDAPPRPTPTFTAVRSSIFGAALRDYPDLNLDTVTRITEGVTGPVGVLALPTLDPPELSAVLRALDRNFPPRPPKTEQELQAEEAAKRADPHTPGRREKRMRPIRVPEIKLLGAMIDGQMLAPPRLQEVSKLPSLPTLHAQLVGLLSAPASQLTMVLNEASGGKLHRTLQGLQKSLEEQAGGPPA
ncbi:hypothetical protein BD626DRAFT_501770 [Schizophyllum amplum]|uniref:50S ribosomal protein L10 n=1 Tax=Schizophyllum amplum TaxID=97359 RepID=A0A550CA53_9AGAR|nr:hypothetical protein BD626DRAFT_501770 [Auriculariopsis ampla]